MWQKCLRNDIIIQVAFPSIDGAVSWGHWWGKRCSSSKSHMLSSVSAYLGIRPAPFSNSGSLRVAMVCVSVCVWVYIYSGGGGEPSKEKIPKWGEGKFSDGLTGWSSCILTTVLALVAAVWCRFDPWPRISHILPVWQNKQTENLK